MQKAFFQLEELGSANFSQNTPFSITFKFNSIYI